jgi:MraZ protein
VPGIYHGSDRHVLDPKGRLNIPARHRRTAGRFGTKLFIMPWLGDFLMILDEEGFRVLSERIRNSGSAEKVEALERDIFPSVSEVEPDDQGRVVIPERLRQEVGIERDVAVLGVNNRLELWNPDRLAAHRAASSLSRSERANGLLI